MRSQCKSGTGGAAWFFRLGACLVAVAMLLSFPANTSHHFDQHFGVAQVRRSIVRHTSVAGPEDSGVDGIAAIDLEPAIPVPIVIASAAKPLVVFEPRAEVSPVRLLHRYKFGRARSDSPDPLL